MNESTVICSRTHPLNRDYPRQYVSALPGHGGADWGYTNSANGGALDKPIALSPYWVRRFRADCRRVGMTFHAS